MKTIKILIISDHRNHVEALNNWIWNVWDTTTDTWKKKNGDIVSNQNVFKDIISILEKGKVQIKIVHIRSHLKSNKTDIKAFCNDMKDKGVYLNPYTAKVFIKFNQIADVYAKYGSTYYTKKYNKSPIKLR
jgi:hypothetical protein